MPRNTIKQWWKARWPLFIILVILLTTTSSSIRAKLDISAVDSDNAALLDEMEHAKRDGFYSILPKNPNKACAGMKTPKTRSACRLQIEWENGVFAVVTTITGIAFISILCFMLMKYSRRSRARRLTRFRDLAMSQPTSRVTTSSRRPVDNDVQTSYRRNVAVVVNAPEVTRKSEVRNETGRQGRPDTLDGVDDGYTIWTRQDGHQPFPRVSPPAPQASAPLVASGIWAEVKLNSLRIRRHKRAALKIRSEWTI